MVAHARPRSTRRVRDGNVLSGFDPQMKSAPPPPVDRIERTVNPLALDDPGRVPRGRTSGLVARAERDRRDADDLDDRHPRRLRRFRLAAVRLWPVAIPDPGGAPRHHQGDRRLQSGRNSGHRPRIANRLRQRRLSRALGRARRRRPASGRAPVHRLPRRLGVGLSAVAGGQVRRARRARSCVSRRRRAARARSPGTAFAFARSRARPRTG